METLSKPSPRVAQEDRIGTCLGYARLVQAVCTSHPVLGYVIPLMLLDSSEVFIHTERAITSLTLPRTRHHPTLPRHHPTQGSPLVCTTPDIPASESAKNHVLFSSAFTLPGAEPLRAHGGTPIGESAGEPRPLALRHWRCGVHFMGNFVPEFDLEEG